MLFSKLNSTKFSNEFLVFINLPNIPINSFSFDSDAPISISLGEEYNFLSSIKYFLNSSKYSL